MKKILALLLALMLVAVCAVACTKTEPADQAETPAAADDSETAEKTDKNDKIKVVFIPKNLGNPYIDTIDAGIRKGIAEIGEDLFDYEYVGPATAEATSQIEYIEAAVQNEADIIYICPNSNDALNGVFDEAREAGTKVVCLNTDIPGSEDHRDAGIMPLNFEVVGVGLLDHMLELIGEGDFAILSATTDAPDQNSWIEDMQNLLATDAKYASLNLVEVVYGDDQPEKSTTETEALLAKYPDLKGIIAPTTVGCSAAAKVLQTTGKGGADGVKLTGLGLPSEMEEFVLDGTVSEFKLWNPPAEGYLAAYFAYEVVTNGMEITAGSTFEAGELGKLEIVDDTNMVYTISELMHFDSENVSEFAAQF